MVIDLRGLLTLLSGETVVIAAEQIHSSRLLSVLLALRGAFPLICFCDKHNVLCVHLDLDKTKAAMCSCFLQINHADFKCLTH